MLCKPCIREQGKELGKERGREDAYHEVRLSYLHTIAVSPRVGAVDTGTTPCITPTPPRANPGTAVPLPLPVPVPATVHHFGAAAVVSDVDATTSSSNIHLVATPTYPLVAVLVRWSGRGWVVVIIAVACVVLIGVYGGQRTRGVATTIRERV